MAPGKTTMKVEDIPKAQVSLLASVFHHPPSEPYHEYASRVYCIEPQLDRPLLRPDFLHRLVQLPQSHYAPLCRLHKILNAKAVHAFFVLLATEVGLRLNGLVVAGRDRVGHEMWDCSILNLRALHGAWLPTEVFWDTFGRTLDVPKHGLCDDDYMTKWVDEGENCEACVLAKIGGDLATVFDLQMILKARTRTKSVRKHHEPRLNGLIDGWLELWKLSYDPDMWRRKLEWNRVRAERLKDTRKRIARQKKHAERQTGDDVEGSKKHRRQKVSEPIINLSQQRSQEKDAPSRVAPSVKQTADSTTPGSSPGRPNQRDANHDSVNSDDDEEDPQVRNTLYDAVNEVIDCYAALISTPFLPGMDSAEHQKRASKLSRHSTVIASPKDVPAWPKVGDPAVQQHLARSQSTKHKRPSNYSESVYSQGTDTMKTSYVPPRQQWKALDKLKRSHSVQDKRTSKESWVTDDMAISPVAPLFSDSDKTPLRSRKTNQRFDAIMEEPVSPRTRGKFTEDLVSPVQEYTRRGEDSTPSRRGRHGRESPVSPPSPTVPSSTFRPESRGRHSRRDDDATRSRPSRGGNTQPSSKVPASSSSRPEFRESNSSYEFKPRPRLSRPFDPPLRPSSSSRPELRESSGSYESKPKPRLSKPFDGPEALPGSLLESVKSLRVRERNDSTATHWSDLYGDQAERIKQLERDLLSGAHRSNSKTDKKGKGRK